jgi:hypothetical protein
LFVSNYSICKELQMSPHTSAIGAIVFLIE